MRNGRTWVGVAVVGLLVSSLGCCFSGMQPVRGSGRMTEKVYAVEGFHGVALTNQGDLTIAYGDEERLVVEAEANLLPYLEARVEGGILHIGTRPGGWIWPTRPIRYRLTVTELDTVSVTGSGDAVGPVLEGEEISVRVTGFGDITLDGIDATDSVDIKVNGSGGARVDGDDADGASVRGERVSVTVTGSGGVGLGEVEADRLEVRVTGSGDLTVAGGRVKGQTISTSGSGVYRARELRSATAEARVSGSGTVMIQVEDELEARLTGSGDVRYAGDPAVHANTTGSGDVVRAGD